VSELFDSLGSLAGTSAYLVIAVLAALETAAFVGLFVPGELGMLIGGYIASEGHAALVPMMVFAAFGAIVGDNLGYQLGRRLGPSMKRSRLGRRVGDERWARAEQYLARRGGRAVFFGRFVGVLRALVPALAGASHMPYRRFVVGSALGAIIWAPTIIYAGYLAGSSYRRIERFAGRAGLVVLGLILMVALVAAVGRWVANHPDEVRAFTSRQAERRLIARLRRRYRTQLQFVTGRLRPGRALGLALTLQLIALGLTGWAFGTLVNDVLAGQGATRVDGPITRALAERRVDWLTSVLHGLTELGGALVLIPVALLAGLVAFRLTRSWTPLLALSAALLGAVLLDDLVKQLVGRPRPDVPPLVATAGGYAFPSGHATQSVAVYGGLAYLTAGLVHSWRAKVALWTGALMVILLVGFSRVYLGVHWATDVFGGYALGAVWLAAVLVTVSAIRGAWYSRNPPPEEPAPGPPSATDVGSRLVSASGADGDGAARAGRSGRAES
jgi:membrane protein DedA with SNARE-associated domain/membrane-associated phospholipid phosphatase